MLQSHRPNFSSLDQHWIDPVLTEANLSPFLADIYQLDDSFDFNSIPDDLFQTENFPCPESVHYLEDEEGICVEQSDEFNSLDSIPDEETETDINSNNKMKSHCNLSYDNQLSIGKFIYLKHAPFKQFCTNLCDGQNDQLIKIELEYNQKQSKEDDCNEDEDETDDVGEEINDVDSGVGSVHLTPELHTDYQDCCTNCESDNTYYYHNISPLKEYNLLNTRRIRSPLLTKHRKRLHTQYNGNNNSPPQHKKPLSINNNLIRLSDPNFPIQINSNHIHPSNCYNAEFFNSYNTQNVNNVYNSTNFNTPSTTTTTVPSHIFSQDNDQKNKSNNNNNDQSVQFVESKSSCLESRDNQKFAKYHPENDLMNLYLLHKQNYDSVFQQFHLNKRLKKRGKCKPQTSKISNLDNSITTKWSYPVNSNSDHHKQLCSSFVYKMKPLSRSNYCDSNRNSSIQSTFMPSLPASIYFETTKQPIPSSSYSSETPNSVNLRSVTISNLRCPSQTTTTTTTAAATGTAITASTTATISNSSHNARSKYKKNSLSHNYESSPIIHNCSQSITDNRENNNVGSDVSTYLDNMNSNDWSANHYENNYYEDIPSSLSSMSPISEINSSFKSITNRGRRRNLLQFIVELLVHGSNCVEWINQNDRTFQIINPDQLTRLWGKYKNNTGMTFESLSRSLRLYYAPGKLKRIQGRHRYQILYRDSDSNSL